MLHPHQKTRPCWVVCTPRVGSTYLCYLLNTTGVFRNCNFKEYFNHRSYTRPQREKFNYYPPPFNKLVWDQLPLEKAKEVTNRLFGIRFVNLYRKDICAQAVSQNLAQQADIWLITNRHQLNRYQNRGFKYHENELLHEYHYILKGHNAIQKWLLDKPHITLSYEQLAADPIMTTLKVLLHIKAPLIDPNPDRAGVKQMTHPQKTEFTDRFRECLVSRGLSDQL